MNHTLLIVDDVEINRDILRELLIDEYKIIEASDGKEAIGIMEREHGNIDAVLLDVIMPVMDGFEVLEQMKKNDWLNKTPVLFITGDKSEDVEQRGFEMGISDYIQKPFNVSAIKKRIGNIVDLFQHRNMLEEKVKEQTLMLHNQFKVLKVQAEQLKESNTNIIDILGTVVEYRNLESGQHIKRVKGFTKILAKQVMEDYPEYGLDTDMVEIIETTSALHDIGKICIPDNILTKPGRLTDDEFECIKTHTTKGCDLLDSIKGIWHDNKYCEVAYEICRYHHERDNGKGYPDGLKGDEIPIAAQIVSVADVYDALVCERVYKSAVPVEKAFNMILEGQCGVFSPKLMECFKKTKDEFEKLNSELHD